MPEVPEIIDDHADDSDDPGEIRDTLKKVVFLDKNVLHASKERILHCLRAFDHVVVSFSGGKDSMVVLELLREVMDEQGLTDKPARFLFRDEELIQDDVIDTVKRYYDDPRYAGFWIACPQDGVMFIMGDHKPYIQWDKAREGRWVRPRPEFACISVRDDDLPLYQTEMNGLIISKMGLTGSVAVLNGIRADESIMRRRSCLIKKDEFNWLMGDPGGARNINFCKVIFDWSEIDVFKYFFDRGVKYAPIYDHQMLSGDRLRVSTPVHEMAYSTLSRLRATYPVFYEQLIDIFPEILTHERYWSEVDRYGVIQKYPNKGWSGLLQFVEDTFNDPEKKLYAKQALSAAKRQKEANMRSGRYSKGGCYGFPFFDLWRGLINGTYRKGFSVKPFPTPGETAFELEASR